jgi:nucleotide-binding universal stress UspA family protein
MFRKLLIPLDGSSLAEEAIGRAAAIAISSNARMDLVLVHEPYPAGGEEPVWTKKRMAEETGYLRGIAAELASGSGITTTFAVVNGDPAKAICDRATDGSADLIVMTSHGRTGWSRAWIGSVADAVSRHAAMPVLMLRPAKSAKDGRAMRHLFQHILVPLDGSPAAMEIAGPVVDLAHCSNARITLLQVVQPVALVGLDIGMPFNYLPSAMDDVATEGLVAASKQQLATAAETLRRAGAASVDGQVVVSPAVAMAICDFARAQHVDAVAMTTRGRGMSRLLIGSVADKVRRELEVPVLIEHPRKAVKPVPLTEESITSQLPALAGSGG